MRRGTRVIRAGLPTSAQGAPFLPGPTFAGTYHAAGEPASAPFTYGRYHNPTWTQYEQALNGLEGGPAIAFASGMAAVAAVFGVVLRPGDIVVLPSDSYYTTRLLAQGYFAQMGVHVQLAPTAGNAQQQYLSGAKLLWLESPSNPGLEVCDLEALVAAAHAAGVLVAVDNTTPTVLGQCPLALGADFSVASDTKALTGHADLILGHVAVRDHAWAAHLHTWRTQMGAVPGPMEVWLAHRALATLDLQLERQCHNALAVAQFLAPRPEVIGVRYPGLPDERIGNSNALLRRQLGSVPPSTLQRPPPAATPCPRLVRRRRSGPQPGRARWSAVWTGSAGWERVGPSAVPWGDGLGQGGWEGWKGPFACAGCYPSPGWCTPHLRGHCPSFNAIASTVEIVTSAETPAAVVLNAAPRGKLADEARTALEGQGITVLPSAIHQRAAYSHAVIDGRAVHEYEPKGKAVEEITELYGNITYRKFKRPFPLTAAPGVPPCRWRRLP